MTARQAQLVAGEIARHKALARTAGEPAIMRSHLEVAEALRAALAGASERSESPRQRKNLTSAPGTVLRLRPFCRNGQRCSRDRSLSPGK